MQLYVEGLICTGSNADHQQSDSDGCRSGDESREHERMVQDPFPDPRGSPVARAISMSVILFICANVVRTNVIAG